MISGQLCTNGEAGHRDGGDAAADRGGSGAYFAGAELVIAAAAGLYLVTVLLVGLLPKHTQQAAH